MSKIDAAEGRQIPIDTANKPQLRAFLVHLGGTPTNFDNEEKLRNKIAQAGWDEPHIIAFDNAEAPAVAKAKAKATKAAPGEVKEPLATVTIHEQPGPGGKRAVFVGVNGRGMLIPRNKQSEIKLRYLRVLENAVETKYEYDEDAKANVGREMPSYPYMVNKMPSQEAIDAWHAYERVQDEKAKARDEAEEAKLRRAA